MSAHLFSDGSALPSPGLGTWKIPEELTPRIVHQAIEIGYRHLDCAADYGNESLVGKGIAKDHRKGLQLIREAAASGYHAPIDYLNSLGLPP